jgi:hypothetical protein
MPARISKQPSAWHSKSPQTSVGEATPVLSQRRSLSLLPTW